MIELLPCPFCGGKAEFQPDADMEGWQIDCTGNHALFGGDRTCCRLATFGYASAEESAAAWNTRTETQRPPQPSRPDEKEGGPAIEDRARLLDALETIDIIWRHYVKPHTSDWRETEKAIKTIRAALGVEPDAAIRERT